MIRKILKIGEWFLLVAVLCIHTDLRAATPISVEATLTPQTATLEDELELTVSVHGSRQASDPELPSVPAFKIIPRGTSSNIQIINSDVSVTKEYQYVLIPQALGTYTIGPIYVVVDGTSYQTQPISVTIESHSPPMTSPGIDPDLNPPGQVSPQTDHKADRDYWIEVTVDEQSPYVNEQILYTFRFFTAVNVGQASLILPDFSGFAVEELVPEKKFYQTMSGVRYVVSEKVLALFPLQSGSLTIGETMLKIEVPEGGQDPFGGRFPFGMGRMNFKTKNLRQPAFVVEVKDLPEGMPADFSGYVGQHFKMSSQLTPQTIKVGDTATLQVKVEAFGNAKDVILNYALDQGNIKVYPDKPLADLIRTAQGVRGTKTFSWALVPLDGGGFQPSPVTASFFDPKLGQFQTVTTEIAALTVSGSSGDQTLHAVKPSVTVNGSQFISDLQTVDSAINEQSWSIFFWIIVILPPILVLGIMIYRNRSTLKSALFSSNKNMEIRMQAAADRDALEVRDRAAEVLALMRSYIGQILSVSWEALTADEIQELLKKKNLTVNNNLIESIRLFENCAYSGYWSDKETISQKAREAAVLLSQLKKSQK